MYEYIPRPALQYDLADITSPLPDAAAGALRDNVQALIVLLVRGEAQGSELSGNLQDCRKVRVDLPPASRHLYPATQDDPVPRWRLVYRIQQVELPPGVTTERLDVVSVGRRGELSAYRVAAARLRRGGPRRPSG